jgi:hypothetical protein
MKRSAMNLEMVSMPPLARLSIIAALTGAIAVISSVLVARAAEPRPSPSSVAHACDAGDAESCIREQCEADILGHTYTQAQRDEELKDIENCIKQNQPKPAAASWRPWQQVWQCNDIRMTITSQTQGLIEYDLGGSIWGGSRFAVDFRRDPWGKYWFNGRPCVQIAGVR